MPRPARPFLPILAAVAAALAGCAAEPSQPATQTTITGSVDTTPAAPAPAQPQASVLGRVDPAAAPTPTPAAPGPDAEPEQPTPTAEPTPPATPTPTPAPAPTPPPPNGAHVRLLTPTVERRGDYLKVVGLVLNEGPQNAHGVTVNALFYDANGTILETESTSSLRSVLRPGWSGPYEIRIEDPRREIADYKFTVTAKPTDQGPFNSGLVVVSHDGRPDRHGRFVVRGEVQNENDREAPLVSAVGLFYNSVGDLIDVASTSVAPWSIPGRSSAVFELAADYLDTKLDIARYEVTVEERHFIFDI